MGIGAAFPSNAFPSNAFPDNAFPAWGAVVPFVGLAHLIISANAPMLIMLPATPSITMSAMKPTISMEVE